MPQQTELSAFVRQLRGETAQITFEDALEKVLSDHFGEPMKLTAKAVSLLETGVTKRISDNLLTALSLYSQKPKGELLAMHRRPVVGGPVVPSSATPTTTLNIVCGHVTWASGLIGGSLSANLEGFRLATCARREDPSDKNWKPSVESSHWIEYIRGKPEPLFDRELFENVNDPSTYYFSAKDAKHALGRWAKVIAVPRAVMDDIVDAVPLARLVSAGACGLLICDEIFGEKLFDRQGWDWTEAKRNWQDTAVTDVRLNAESLGENLESNDLIGAEDGTIGAVVGLQAVFFVGNDKYEQLTKIDLQKARCPERTADSGAAGGGGLLTLDDLQVDPRGNKEGARVSSAVVWQPQATWIMRALKKARPDRIHALIPILPALDKNYERRPRFEFDLVTTLKYAHDPDVIRMMEQLLLHVARTSRELDKYKIGSSNDVAPALARYFNLGEDNNFYKEVRQTMQVIGSVGYDVLIDPTTAFEIFSKGTR